MTSKYKTKKHQFSNFEKIKTQTIQNITQFFAIDSATKWCNKIRYKEITLQKSFALLCELLGKKRI
ncbi:MAG: hypothetical protein OSA44_10690, partial [Nitrospinaceae bacterium]|nr:hypothetical protein [Nitrospinaceae bacterium]